MSINKSNHKCKACNGTKHVYADGRYRRCDCVLESVRRDRCTRANVPPTAILSGLSNLCVTAGVLPDVLRGMINQCEEPCLYRVACGRLSERRVALVAAVLRTAIERLNYTAIRYTLDQLIEDRFADESNSEYMLRNSVVCVIEADVESANKMVPVVLASALQTRIGMPGFTMIVTSGQFDKLTGLYGKDLVDSVCSRFTKFYDAHRELRISAQNKKGKR